MEKDKQRTMEEQRARYEEVYAESKLRWDNIAKPIDSLGLLEDAVAKLCAIAEDSKPYDMRKRAVVALCGDHGVCAEGVTQTGQDVTRVVAENFARGCSSVNYMSKVAGADVFAVDIGMVTGDVPEVFRLEDEKHLDDTVCEAIASCIATIQTGRIINCKCAMGTGNLAKEAAMTLAQCEFAIKVGEQLVAELRARGYGIIATGEMGIGNTTPTSVLAAKLLGLTAEQATGRGAGLDDAGFARKKRVVERALSRIRDLDFTEMPDTGCLRLLSEVGGFEIAGMVGLFLGGVKYRIPIVIDGAISAVAALVASRMNPLVPLYAMASHVSEEATGKFSLSAMGLEAMLHGHLCLGEGTGAVLLFPLLDMALSVYGNMGTFADLDITAYERSGKPKE